MAIAGGGIPARLVCIRNGRLEAGGQVNVPKFIVECDMAMAADALRRNPDRMIRIDALRYNDLLAYLRNSGDVE